jgi:DNA-binding IscR family transcriptional regulator
LDFVLARRRLKPAKVHSDPGTHACLLKGALAEARDAFLAAIDHYTLADLAKPRRRLSALFHVEPRHA